MPIHVALEHRTTYDYDRLVNLGPQVVRLRPAPHTRTPIVSYSLRVEPSDHFVSWQQDPFGNFLARYVFEERTRRFDVVVDLVAELVSINPFDFFLEEDAEHWPVTYDAGLRKDLAPYLATEEPGPLLAEFLASLREDVVEDERRTIDVLVDLNQRTYDEVAYDVRMEPGVQTPEETLGRAIGSCRDSGWLLVHVLRHLGLAARFASGYLVQLAADQEALDGPSGPQEDFTDLHAWTEVYLPGAGWVGLDPTSGLFAGEGHIPLACTPEPSSAAPISGAVDEAEVEFSFSNTVTRVHEDPRVTKPYTEEQWERVTELGREVDRRLVRDDVRLTQGGEPTFVSVDDRESPEWTIAADGEHKRERAWDLTQRVQQQFAPGGLIQLGQGKWYPGEPLPRWQFGVHWREDGEPLWAERELLADPWAPGSHDEADAATMAAAIAERIGVDPAAVVPGYEDALHALWEEASLPVGPPPSADVDPDDERLADAAARAELIAALDARGGTPVGHVLPLRHDGLDWRTSEWSFRRGRLNLLPGDSPMGLRLPLHSLAWTPAPPEPERDPLEQRHRLAPHGTVRPGQKLHPLTPGDGSLSSVCVEVREGRLHVFLPPLTHLEHLVELLGAVESSAEDLGMPVVVEGYGPPSDHRLESITIAPDPGVIEVNVHPAASWDELQDVTTRLYEEARKARLTTETFDVDGTHTGTGGGNHITLGGPTPADSPLLRRPDLLRSLVTYWQHHPSLSYLFASRFLGPTSQAPRVDEGRDDRLHDLDIALEQLDALDDEPRPWIVDRILRNLLTDLTGNTHRAEFCIDKLYSPDSARGRLGLLELRSFEMPPHERMAMVQSLLVRSLVSRFWEEPYRQPTARWGTLLHDRFLLPWFVQRDLDDIVTDLRDHDVPFEAAWLDPFTEFRFPRLGTVDVRGVELELRAGIEPWDVLGEEVTAQGTARFVDSSMERVQMLVRGATPERHVVTVNGRPLPLHPTGEPGTSVAGVRYRAWAPPSGLHPTIGVQAPLTFDLVDRWNGRSIGGCSYHVVPPNGAYWDTRPVNAVTAESRRVARFFAHGHTPGPVDVAALDRHGRGLEPDSPVTLDLRTGGPR